MKSKIILMRNITKKTILGGHARTTVFTEMDDHSVNISIFSSQRNKKMEFRDKDLTNLQKIQCLEDNIKWIDSFIRNTYHAEYKFWQDRKDEYWAEIVKLQKEQD